MIDEGKTDATGRTCDGGGVVSAAWDGRPPGDAAEHLPAKHNDAALAERAARVRADALQEALAAVRSLGSPVGAGDDCGTRIVGSSADAERRILALIGDAP